MYKNTPEEILEQLICALFPKKEGAFQSKREPDAVAKSVHNVWAQCR